MHTDYEKFYSASNTRKRDFATPKPGEIWELSSHVRFPEEFLLNQTQDIYSSQAQSFLQGKTPPRYVMIVTEPEADGETESEIVSVMVLSRETQFISDVDLLIPSEITGLAEDLLAETWHVQPMLVSNLLQPIGKRLARNIYDILLSIGDYNHGLVTQAPSIFDIELLGLKLREQQALSIPEIARFHQQEQSWSDVLTIPVAIYHTYIKSVNFTNQILHEQLQIEQDLAEINLNQIE